MKELDTAKIHDIEQYLEWYTNLSVEEAQAVVHKLKKVVNPGYSPRVLDEVAAIDRFFTVQGGYGGPDPNNSQEAKWARQRIENADKLRQFCRLLRNLSSPCISASGLTGSWPTSTWETPARVSYSVSPRNISQESLRKTILM